MTIGQKNPRKPVRAAGGIVMRAGPPPLFAVVQMRKFDAWVLPKGKLDRGETAIDAARREVLEETGHEVSIHEFVGTLAYEVGGRQKIVQFWRMQALSDEPTHALMDDIRSVRWLPLDQAVETLTHLREREFLSSVGTFMHPAALGGGQDQVGGGRAGAAARPGLCSLLADKARGWLRRIQPDRAQN